MMESKPPSRKSRLATALAATPVTWFISVVVVNLVGGLDTGLTALQGYSMFWAITGQAVASFCIALLYVAYESKKETRATLNAMCAYWRWKVDSNNDTLPKRSEDQVREVLTEQLRRWTWAESSL